MRRNILGLMEIIPPGFKIEMHERGWHRQRHAGLVLNKMADGLDPIDCQSHLVEGEA